MKSIPELMEGSNSEKNSRKKRLETTVRVRDSAINSDIPSDGYSWRKYGQKLIKGSPYPR